MNRRILYLLAGFLFAENAAVFCNTDSTKNRPASFSAAIGKTIQIDKAIDFIEMHKNPESTIGSEELYYTAKYYADIYDLDVAVLVALMRKESDFTQNARSRKNCYGICQVSWGALDRYNTVNWGKNFYEWSELKKRYDINLDVACWYLTWLWKNFDTITNLRDLLIAYNVGPSDLDKYKNRSGYRYADDIITWAEEIRKDVK